MLARVDRHRLKVEAYSDRDRTLESLGFRSYRGYLRSRLWEIVRERALEIHGRTCRKCQRPANQVHHATYTRETLIGENVLGLVPVCAFCHETASVASGTVRPLAVTNFKLVRRKQRPGRQKAHFCRCGRMRKKNHPVCKRCR